MNESKHAGRSAGPLNELSEYHRKLSDLVRNGGITCITIDTNVVIDNGKSLSGGVVAQLAQFCGEPIRFLITDVVISESKKHIAEAHEDRIQNLKKLARGASRYLECGPELQWLEDEIEAIRPAEHYAEEEMEAFLQATHAIVIDANYVSTSQILEWYFAGSAPFAKTGPKKCEFPDAIALGGIESWARETSCGILVVSSDSDWARFCKESNTDRLFIVAQLSDALSLIQESNDDRLKASRTRVERLVGLMSDSSWTFRREVQDKLKQAIIDTAVATGTSWQFRFEAGIERVDDGLFVFSEAEPPVFLRNDANALVIFLEITASCTFWVRFSFFDRRTNALMGQGVYGVEKEVLAGLIVTSEGDSVTVEIKAAPDRLIIDCGEVEPDPENEISHP